jgi:hypothetical protein
VTDQPSQQPSDETRDDVPAQLAPDAPTEVRPSESTAPGVKPSAPAAESWAPAPAPAPAFGTTEPGPTPYEGGSSSGGLQERLQELFPPEHPEYAAGAAFAGGLLLALILKRLAD